MTQCWVYQGGTWWRYATYCLHFHFYSGHSTYTNLGLGVRCLRKSP